MNVAEKLTKNAITNDSVSHITIESGKCIAYCKERHCVNVCPAGLYEWNEQAGKMMVEYAGCLECGTCLVACKAGALSWRYPKGGCGVQYRYG